MMRVGVDTNVVLSFVTDREARQQEIAAQLFEHAVSGACRIVVPQTVISEGVYVLGNVYGVDPERVRAILRDLTRLPGVATVDAIDWDRVWDLWPGRLTDFGDACLAAVGRAGDFDELATFDQAFAARARRVGVASYWSA